MKNFLIGLALIITAVNAVNADEGTANADLKAKYAVGVQTNFVRDFSRSFDDWGRVYKSDKYQVLLNKIEGAGDVRTTFTQIYYPTKKGKGSAMGRANTTIPAALPAAKSGTQMTPVDVFAGNAWMAKAKAERSGFNSTENPYQAYMNTPIAKGKFPLVFMIHGLSSSVETWASAAEYLAAQGYIVVTVSLTSDSTGSPIFDDSMSKFAAISTPEEITAAYQLRSDNTGRTVFSNFYKFLFQYEGPLKGLYDIPDASKMKPTREGALRSNQMMRDLFEQRASDVSQVLSEMKKLNMAEESCRTGLHSERNPEPLCGFFAGHIDLDHVGIIGHSLGSMTAQIAGSFFEEIDAVVGFNNGLPFMWEPWGGLPGDTSEDVPVGVSKPFMQIVGSDDFFIYNVFRRIHILLYKDAGGNPSDNYPLPTEALFPTPEIPQAVALSAHERAQDTKLMLTFHDQTHEGTTDSISAHFRPGEVIKGRRVPFERTENFETYDVLGWVKDGTKDVFMPHLMRNYFLTNWFDWQLKSDDSARQNLLDHPFGDAIDSLRQEGLDEQ